MYAIGMCVDERYLLPAMVTIGSLASVLTASERRDIAVRILTMGLTRSHTETLAAYAGRVGFGSFDLRWTTPPRWAVMADDSYITATTYLRFMFTARFVGRPYLLYLDADTLVLADPSTPLAQLDDEAVGAVPDEFNPEVGVGTALPGLAEARPAWRGRRYYNAGALWIPATMLALMHDGVRRSVAAGRAFIHHNDQDALNLWLLTHGRAQPVSPGFNHFEVSRFLEHGDWVRRVIRRPPGSAGAAVLHYVGPNKPWLPDCPITEDVRTYRKHMGEAARHVRRLGDLGAAAAVPW